MSHDTSRGSCLARVRAMAKDGSTAAKRIARFILGAPMRVRDVSLRSLAAACDTSPATVSRFCRDLGYEGFKKFQLDLAVALAQNEPLNLEELGHGASPERIIQQVFECNRRSLTETEKLLDSKTLAKVAGLVRRAKRVAFIGIGGSSQVARQAAERFMSLGLPATAVTDPYEQIFASASLGRNDVLVGISHTGETAQVIEALRAARRKGVRTVALTNYPQSSLAKTGEFKLVTAFPEHRINVAVSSSRIAQMCVIDSLYFVVGNSVGTKARKLADEVEDRARSVLRARISVKGSSEKKGR